MQIPRQQIENRNMELKLLIKLKKLTNFYLTDKLT